MEDITPFPEDNASDNTPNSNSTQLTSNPQQQPPQEEKILGGATTLTNNHYHYTNHNNPTATPMDRQYQQARILANQKQVIGGLLVPSYDEAHVDVDQYTNPTSYDEFFDCNDGSFSAYMSLVRPNIHNSVSGNTGSTKDENNQEGDSGRVHTRIKIHLLGGSIKLQFVPPHSATYINLLPHHIREDDAITTQKQLPSPSSSSSSSPGYLLFSFGDLNITSNSPSLNDEYSSDLQMDMSHVELEDFISSPPTPNITTSKSRIVRNDIESLVRFVEEVEDCSYVVTAPPVVSFSMNRTRRQQQENQDDGQSATAADECTMEINLQPLQIIYREATLTNLNQFLKRLTKNDSNINTPPPAANNEPKSKTTITCTTSSTTLFIPIPTKVTEKQEFNNTISSRGYSVQNADYILNKPALGISLEAMSLEHVIQNEAPQQPQTFSEYSTCSIDNVACFVIYPLQFLEGGGGSVHHSRHFRRMDFCSISGDSKDFTPDSVVKISYYKTKKASTIEQTRESIFPLFSPLSAVKASQAPMSNETSTVAVRGEDPSSRMLHEAEKCENTLDILVPSLVVDISLGERHCIMNILSCLGGEKDKEEVHQNELTSQEANDRDSAGATSSLAVTFTCNRISCILHEGSSQVQKPQQQSHYAANIGKIEDTYVASFILIADNFKTHIVLSPGSSSALSQLRVLVGDLTLYEALHRPPPPNNTEENHYHHSTSKKLELKRFADLVSSTPIFYRSKLSQPLSPETPCFHIDLMQIKEDDDDDTHRDSEIHASMYDMTWRYDMESTWFHRFISLIKGELTDDGSTKPDGEENGGENVKDEDKDLCETNMTKLFVTLSDCTIDYTPPKLQPNFQCASRSMICFGEIYVSSNLVSFAPVQAYKIALADISIHLCNTRYPYDVENTRLSCSGRVLPFQDLDTSKEFNWENGSEDVPLEDILNRMGFVSVATVDSIDSFVKVHQFTSETDVATARLLSPSITISDKKATPIADITMELTVGRLCLYTCRDSFTCLTNTFGEWILKFTSLSQEGIIAAKEAAAASSGPMILVEDDDGGGTNKIQKNPVLIGEQKDVCEVRYSTFSEQKLKQNGTCSIQNVGSTTTTETRHISLLDAIDENMFIKKDNLQNDGSVSPSEKKETPLTDDDANGSSMEKSFADIPDSELSATELRKKHGVIDVDDVATNLAKSLLIKNFYTVDTSTLKHGTDDGYGDNSTTKEDENNRAKQKCNTIFDGDDFEITNDTRAALADLISDGVLLDGYDWTTVDHDWSAAPDSGFVDNGKGEQHAKWYSSPTRLGGSTNTNDSNNVPSCNNANVSPLHIFTQHVPITTVFDPLMDGDMDAAEFAGTDNNSSPHVQFRVLVKDMSMNCRFFDGSDWVVGASSSTNNSTARANAESSGVLKEEHEKERLKETLLGELLGSSSNNQSMKDTKDHIDELFPEEVKKIENQKSIRRGRQVNNFFEFSASGVRLRLDSFSESSEHRLASCMDLKVMNFFLSESISSLRPKKMLGEWVNEVEHPRDTNDGMIMMKMVSMHPTCMFSADGKLMSDESRVKLELLPLRCHLEQNALRFIRLFFSSDDEREEPGGVINDAESGVLDSSSSSEVINSEVFFELFKVKPLKVKVNYRPVTIDSQGLRDGNYVELLNLFSLEDIELTLQSLEMTDIAGWGFVLSEMACRFIEDICATQMHKFLSGAAPFHSISNIGVGVADLFLIPVHQYKTEGKVMKGVRKATSKFGETVAVETLNATSKLAQYVAKKLNKVSSRTPKAMGVVSLPARPEKVPCRVSDTAGHAYESVSRGLQSASYTLVVATRREYKKNGTTGAINSVVRAIPVAILAPLSGASEALSYTLLGVRNQIRPDIRKEEEARQIGLL